MWTLAFGHHEDRTPTHGYVATREAAMAAFCEELSEGVNKKAPPCLGMTGLKFQMERAMQCHVLANAELIGTYQKR
jgi:hypothetical protein